MFDEIDIAIIKSSSNWATRTWSLIKTFNKDQSDKLRFVLNQFFDLEIFVKQLIKDLKKDNLIIFTELGKKLKSIKQFFSNFFKEIKLEKEQSEIEETIKPEPKTKEEDLRAKVELSEALKEKVSQINQISKDVTRLLKEQFISDNPQLKEKIKQDYITFLTLRERLKQSGRIEDAQETINAGLLILEQYNQYASQSQDDKARTVERMKEDTQELEEIRKKKTQLNDFMRLLGKMIQESQIKQNPEYEAKFKPAYLEFLRLNTNFLINRTVENADLALDKGEQLYDLFNEFEKDAALNYLLYKMAQDKNTLYKSEYKFYKKQAIKALKTFLKQIKEVVSKVQDAISNTDSSVMSLIKNILKATPSPSKTIEEIGKAVNVNSESIFTDIQSELDKLIGYYNEKVNIFEAFYKAHKKYTKKENNLYDYRSFSAIK